MDSYKRHFRIALKVELKAENIELSAEEMEMLEEMAAEYVDEYPAETVAQMIAPEIISAGVLVSVVFMIAFSVTVQEMTRSIQRRGYARPVGPSQFDRLVKWAVPVTEPEASHPTQYQRSKILVRFDSGEPYEVDTGKLYFVLLAEVEHTGGILTWERCVIKNKMDKRAWAAYRQVLIQAEVVEIDGRGSMRLNCQPWAAVEIVKQRC